jgi:hypothetical protein
MKSTVIFISLIILSLTAFAQEEQIDSTMFTFTVRTEKDAPCNPSSAFKFRILKSDSTQSFNSVFVLLSDIQIPLTESATYTLKGFITTKEEWVYDCGNSRHKELRIYINPKNSIPLIIKNSN